MSKEKPNWNPLCVDYSKVALKRETYFDSNDQILCDITLDFTNNQMSKLFYTTENGIYYIYRTEDYENTMLSKITLFKLKGTKAVEYASKKFKDGKMILNPIEKGFNTLESSAKSLVNWTVKKFKAIKDEIKK